MGKEFNCCTQPRYLVMGSMIFCVDKNVNIVDTNILPFKIKTRRKFELNKLKISYEWGVSVLIRDNRFFPSVMFLSGT